MPEAEELVRDPADTGAELEDLRSRRDAAVDELCSPRGGMRK
jgi:hypothetical protein